METIGTGDDVIEVAIRTNEDAAIDEWHDGEAMVDDGDGTPESKGVDSEAGGMLMLVLASRLHTGQKVLHDVSQESTQVAWNSGRN